jgi:hypothetical protein
MTVRLLAFAAVLVAGLAAQAQCYSSITSYNTPGCTTGKARGITGTCQNGTVRSYSQATCILKTQLNTNLSNICLDNNSCGAPPNISSSFSAELRSSSTSGDLVSQQWVYRDYTGNYYEPIDKYQYDVVLDVAFPQNAAFISSNPTGWKNVTLICPYNPVVQYLNIAQPCEGSTPATYQRTVYTYPPGCYVSNSSTATAPTSPNPSVRCP